jgi:hypothetical protein
MILVTLLSQEQECLELVEVGNLACECYSECTSNMLIDSFMLSLASEFRVFIGHYYVIFI